jgi:DNA-binding transcriptional regulator YhcF (GntR family)
VYKKRGLGMFIAEHAQEAIRKKRREQTLQQLIRDVVAEADNLGVEESELLDMIQRAIARRKDDSHERD